MSTLVTVGHGTLPAEAFSSLLADAGVALVVDVRRYPGSRRNPQFSREPLRRSLDDAGIRYRWEERLGGRRRGAEGSPHTAVRNASFRAYADWMWSADWRAAMEQLVADARDRQVAIMCSEAVWWRCHRRFVADAAVLLHGLTAHHLMHDGSRQLHTATPAARVDGRQLVYDA